MRKIVKRTLAGAFTAVFALAAVGCGESGKDSSSAAPGEATQLTVFIASDRVKGTNESKVTEAVERKFEEDTGKAVKLNFLVYNKSDFASAVENSKASSSWDAAVSYLGIAGVDDNLIRQGAAADLQDYLFEDYCKKYRGRRRGKYFFSYDRHGRGVWNPVGERTKGLWNPRQKGLDEASRVHGRCRRGRKLGREPQAFENDGTVRGHA